MEPNKFTSYQKIALFIFILASIAFGISSDNPNHICRIWDNPKCELIVDKTQVLSMFGIFILSLILVLISKKSTSDFRLIKESAVSPNSPLGKYKKWLVILLLLLIGLLITTISISTTHTYCLSSASPCPFWGKVIVVVLLLISVLMSQLIWVLHILYRYSYHNYYRKRFGYKKLQDTSTFYAMRVVLLVAVNLSLLACLFFMLFIK